MTALGLVFQPVLFHQIDFLLFFAIVWLLYGVLRRDAQNWLLLAASIVFYGSWDYRFLGLLFLSGITDYTAGWVITHRPGWKRSALVGALAINVTILGFFKYFDFFTGSFNALLGAFGLKADLPTLHLIVPAGLSFYTFQAMSYTIDVYRGKSKACLHMPTFFLYVMYFPHMVAGPIQRAHTLIPQLEKPRRLSWEMASTGAWFFLLGLFKKVAIADLCAENVDAVFRNIDSASLLGLLGASIGFLFQLYADFSGYTDMAVGVSLLLGIRLSRSFRQPLLSTSLSDFWRRWNITVTSWFREYLYEPLRGPATTGLRANAGLVATFILIGLWHGPRWTWVLWGAITGAMILAERAVRRMGEAPLPTMRTAGEAVSFSWSGAALYPVKVSAAFLMVAIPAVFAFRLGSLTDLPSVWPQLGHLRDFPSSWNALFPWFNMAVVLAFVDAPAEIRNIWPAPADYPALARAGLYLYFLLAILSSGGNVDAPYVYFQF